jgi:ribosomal protein S18 acetylase RimI-like enzyme
LAKESNLEQLKTGLPLYADYLQERENAHILENENGFCIYKYLSPTTAYLQDIYVKPEWRKTAIGKKMLEDVVKICKKSNISALLASTDISANNPEVSALAILKSGFKFHKLEENMIWYVMEIK